jgi:hypothetical protein
MTPPRAGAAHGLRSIFAVADLLMAVGIPRSPTCAP